MIILKVPIVEGTPEKQRADSFLAKELAGQLSRSSISKLIKQGKVSLAGETLGSKSASVKPGDELVVNYIDPVTKAAMDKDFGQSIESVYEDENQVVINKPAGILSHAKGSLPQELTVADWVHPKTRDLTPERSGIVHRLDRATSGVMILAKNPDSKSWLMKQFSSRNVHKKYLAIIDGDPTMVPDLVKAGKFDIDMPIDRNPKKPTTFHVSQNGRPSQTNVQILTTNGEQSLVLLQPKTGRTHQLRVHMWANGWPILGDPFYHPRFKEGQELMLHAFAITIQLIKDDGSKQWQDFNTSPPKVITDRIRSLFPEFNLDSLDKLA